MQTKKIHIGNIIKQKFEESSMSIDDFANKIHKARTTVYNIFKRQSIDIELLIKISDVLNYDFYNEEFFDKKTNNFSEKVLLAVEIDKKKLTELDLPEGIFQLLTQD